MLQRSRPSELGSIRSRTMRSGGTARALSSAAFPSSAQVTSKPSNVRLSRSTLASGASSSTMRMRFFMFARDRQHDGYGRTDVHRAPDRQRSAVIVDDALGDGQPEPAPVLDRMTAAEELSRDVLDLVLRDSAP